MPEPPHIEKSAVLLVGARDWDFSAWIGGYYPDDLPESWRLTYYANEHSVVLLPHQRWAACSPEKLRAWCEDAAENFRFFLELGCSPENDADWSRLLARGDILGDRFGGVLCQERLRLPPARLPPALAGRWFEVLTLPQPGGDLDLQAGSGAKAVIADAGELGGLRAQRRLFENLASGLRSQREVPFFLGGNPPSLRALQEAKQLAELMGLA